MSLATFLSLVILLSVGCLILAGRATVYSSFSTRRFFKIITTAYALLLCLLLAAMIYSFIGKDKAGSPRIPDSKQRYISHTGYYFSRDGELTLIGPQTPRQPSEELTQESADEEDGSQETRIIRHLLPTNLGQTTNDGKQASNDNAGDGFVHPALGPGEQIKMRPIWDGEKATKWRITYLATGRPLRFVSQEGEQTISKCVNLAEERWLNPDDTIFITLNKGGEIHFVNIKWHVGSKYPWPFTRLTNAYYYSQGVIRNDQLVYEKGPDLLISEAVLRDGIELADLIKRAKADFRKAVGMIDEAWWSVFSDLTLVRERRGDSNSRIGLFIDDELFHQSDLRIYKNYQGSSSSPLTAQRREVSTEISTSTSIVYGLGHNNTLELRPTDSVVEDNIWGQIVHVRLASAQQWPLPPLPTSEFIITAANDYIPLDGYFINVGNSSHSFYAKAKLNESLDTLSINDGKNTESDKSEAATKTSGEEFARKFQLNQAASLGDFQQGVLLTLISAQAAVPYTGLIAIGLILLNAIAFTLLVWLRKSDTPKLFLGWTLIWGFLLTILTVRLILAYRVSLLPPLDASPDEIQNVFNKGVVVSLWGLGLCAALALAVPLLASFWEWVSEKGWVGYLLDSRPIAVVVALLWGLAIGIWIVAGKYLGANQSFLGMRINMFVHLLIVLGLVFLAEKALDEGWVLKVWISIVLLAAFGLQIGLVKDAGSIIYAISLLICLLFLFCWNSILGQPRRWSGWVASIALIVGALAPMLVVLGILHLPPRLLPYLTETEWIRSAARPAIPATTFYRFASFTDSAEALLTARSVDDEASMNVLLDNSRQDWQMLLYASHGASDPKGYGQVPLSRRGMTYSTSMADCVFSTYLLAEHGKAAAFFLLLIYLALGLTCLYSGWFLPKDLGHRNLLLVVIGAFFTCNALYMAGANVALTVFTGQNIPLLGLYSGTDLIQGLALIGLAGCLLLATNTDASPGYMISSHPVSFWIVITLGVGLAYWLAMVNWRMVEVGNEARYREDHNFSKPIFTKIKDNLPPSDDSPGKRQNAPWTLVGDQLKLKPGSPIEEVERQYANQFNERTDKYNPNGGLYYLERGRNPSGAVTTYVKVNEHYFLARSPFRESAMWRGRVVARGVSDPMISALGGTLTVSLEDKGYPGSIDLSKSLPVRATSSVLFTEGGKQFFELKRVEDRLRIDPKGRSNQWSVFVDGRRITSAIDLKPLNIIVIESKDSKLRRNLIYLGPTPPILAFVRWRNGEQRRIFPKSVFPLAYLLGKVGDVAYQLEAGTPGAEHTMGEQLSLNIDFDLQQKLQAELFRYAQRNSNYSALKRDADTDSLQPNRLAVTVLDAFTGQTLALPSWPILDPGREEYETLMDKIPESIRSRFEYNHNLFNHVAGSTIKPLVFSTMASALWPRRDLAGITVINRADRYTHQRDEDSPVHPHLKVGGINIGLWDCNDSKNKEISMSDFLINSRDYPEGAIGMLGMVTDVQEIDRVLAPSQSTADITYGGQNYIFDLTRSSEKGTAFSIQDQFDKTSNPTTRGPEALKSTLLFTGLVSNFDFSYQDSKSSWLHTASSNFLPMLDSQKYPLEENFYIDNVIPAQVNMSNGDFQDIRGGLISCLLGGGDCGFNNVKMAEAAARLATGQRIIARLENTASAPTSMLPDPLGRADWRNTNIINPLQKVGETGTAKFLINAQALGENVVKIPTQYKAIYKTGTILEGNDNRESETLLFVIGRWENGGFVRGETVAGYLYMEKSKDKKGKGEKDTTMKKFDFAAPILNSLIKYLQGRSSHM